MSRRLTRELRREIQDEIRMRVVHGPDEVALLDYEHDLALADQELQDAQARIRRLEGGHHRGWSEMAYRRGVNQALGFAHDDNLSHEELAVAVDEAEQFRATQGVSSLEPMIQVIRRRVAEAREAQS